MPIKDLSTKQDFENLDWAKDDMFANKVKNYLK